ncbi:hypothetical protein [Aureimonas sp. AU20]|uniref:hypothetical protein n=1 Tax=Aureimonas sp. AU20 TaxID=1349819 RepID=UPI00072039B8|nr:hypothetical protein [Aureimonas sp. AU20]ALN71453.1 hypothetical protein M673_01945 [Aureimonas sp. AU20]
MKSFKAALAVSGLMLLGGCVSATQYAATSEALKGSPALRRDGVESCIKRNRVTPAQKDLMRKLMNLAPGSNVDRVACERLIGGIASGRLTHEDYRNTVTGHVTPQVIRVLQAR